MRLKYRAKAHGYWLDGERCKSPSAIAKVPDDSSALDKWRRRQTAIGLAMRPELLTEIAGNVEDKVAIDAICERAMDHAGASSGRNWGSAVHLIIERDISGQTILETPETARVRAQWQQLLTDHRLEVVRAEAVIVHPDLLIAGRFDQVMRCTVTGEMFVMDVKTGASADQYLHSHAVQLWLYASAPLMGVGPQGDVDFEITEFEPMHEVSQSVAFVAHLPQDGDPSIIPIDIAAGAECFETVIRPTWAWRARKDLRAAMPVTAPTTPEPKPVVTFSGDRPDPQVLIEQLRALGASVELVQEQDRESRETLTILRVALGNRRPFTYGWAASAAGKVAVLERAKADINRQLGIPIGFEPATVAVTVAPDEGPDVDLEALRGRYKAAGEGHRAWVDGIRAGALAAGADIHLKDHPTMRRARILDGLLTLCEAEVYPNPDCCEHHGDPEPCQHKQDANGLVRALVRHVTGDDAGMRPTVTVGAAVGAMGAREAADFAAACELFVLGRFRLVHQLDGAVVEEVAA